MRRILRLAMNDLRLTRRDRASFVWMLLMPVAMMWIFGQTGGSGPPPKAALTVVDRDRGWIARALVAELAGPRIDLEEIAPAEQAAAKPVRTLVIPEGFTAGVIAGRQQVLRVERDKNANQDFTLAAETHVVRAITRTLGRLVELHAAAPLAGRAAAAATADLARLAQRDPLVRLDVSTAGAGRPVPAGTAQSVPGIMTMTVLMMTLIYGSVFLTVEKRDGTLRRQLALPVTRGQVILGKLFGRLLVAAVQIVLLVIAGSVLFHVDFGAHPAAMALLLACYALCVAGLSVMLGALLRTPEQASAVGWMASMVLAALGGCWWPSEVVPRWLWQASHVLPTAWAMDGFHALISFGRGFDGAFLPSAVLAAFGVVFFAIGARFLRAAT